MRLKRSPLALALERAGVRVDEHALRELLVFAKQPRGAVDVGRLVRSCAI